MESQIEQKVVSFFKEWGIYNNNLKNKTIINTIDQDFLDMEMVFELFFKEFNVSNSEMLNVNKYFYKISFFNKLLMKLGFELKIKPKPSLTISHMAEVAKRKEWFDPK